MQRRLLPASIAAAGLLACAYLQVHHVRAYLDPSVSSFCSLGETMDCDTVALAGSSVLLGVPVAIWGLLGYAAILFAVFRRPALVLPLATVAAVAGIAFTIVSFAVVGSVCLVCEGVHVASLALFVVAWRGRDVEATRAALRAPKTIALPIGVPLVVLGVLHFALPKYWTLASWENGVDFAHGRDEEGRPWIGARDPDLVVHEYINYYCVHCRVAHGRMRMRLAAHPDALRIVRHHVQRMSCAPPRRGDGGQRCHASRVAICADRQGKFWEMDDWLVGHGPGGHVRIDLARAARDVGIDESKLRRCMTERSTWERAEEDEREAKARGIRGTPSYVIDGRLMKHADADEEIDRRL